MEQKLVQVPVGAASLDLLHRGSAEAFIEALCADALSHPAVDHPYLWRLAEGGFADMPAAVRDYCHQYAFYCADFPAYLQAVIRGLSSSAHRKLVMHNLNEERGSASGDVPAGRDDVPHTELFRRFQRAAGVTEAYVDAHPPCTTVSIWRDLFLQKCGARQVGIGLGAIGIGTELIVSTVYQFLHRAVTGYTDMRPEDYLFLTVHLDCDDGHADQMKAISVEMAEDLRHREALRFGALSALNLRNAFWDVMLARGGAR